MSSPRKKVKTVPEPINVRLGDIVKAYGSKPTRNNPQARPGPLLKLFDDSKPDAKTSFRLAMVERELRPILKAYSEARLALLNEYAYQDEEDEKSDNYHFWKRKPDPDDPKDEGEVDEERREVYNEAVTDLLDELRPISEVITIDDLSKAKIELSPSETLLILWILKEGRDKYEPFPDEEDDEPEPNEPDKDETDEEE